jgi:crotonobetainyl-CoA:carnitine CoA-transferase CaiB-like acyl-CoA transferase
MDKEFLPLDGVRVVDVTSSLAGPYCTEILAALGADVVKVEHPGRGDEARAWGPPFWEDASVMFDAANLSKRSLALDINRGRDVLLRLVERADVFLQSLRPGTVRRLGYGADELRDVNPRLVYCDIGAFGRVGPLRERPGYGPLLQALGGIMIGRRRGSAGTRRRCCSKSVTPKRRSPRSDGKESCTTDVLERRFGL